MNRYSRDSLAGGRNVPLPSTSSLLLQQRRGRTAAANGAGGVRDGGDDVLDLFAKNRRSYPVVASSAEEEVEGPPKLGSISIGSSKIPRSGVDDLLSGADMGKHDYDWLLTPPGTPLVSSSDASEYQLSSVAPRSNPSARSVTAAKASRFSVSQTENNHHPTRPVRSSSLTRPSVSSAYSGHFSNNSNRNSVLNTSTSSVTSNRPSTPSKRPTTASATSRQTAPASRPTSSCPSTPVKTRPTPSSTADKPRPLNGTRPSTPTSRPHIPTSLSSSSSSLVSRSNSRPSTPTRRASAPSSTSVPTRPLTPTRRTPTTTSASAPTRSPSVGRVPATNGRISGPPSRPSSPGPRPRPPAQPLVLPDFPNEVPPNLRTKLPDRPASAGRTRPGAALTVRANLNSEAPTSANQPRRPSSPISTRGRFPENSPKAQLNGNGRETTPPEIQKPMVSDGAVRKPAKTSANIESTGFGRTISKKSLDMALRHMDIRQGIGAIRGAALFPQSIRLTASKGRPARMSDPVVPIASSVTDTEDNNCDGTISVCYSGAPSENGESTTMSPDREFLMKRATEPDVYESSRYDAILLKEDSKNMSWLHSIEDKSDQSPVFDHRFEPLPEPFSLI